MKSIQITEEIWYKLTILRMDFKLKTYEDVIKYLIKQGEKKVKCVICHKEAGKLGNNAQPLMEGQCCDYCNSTIIIPHRLGLLLTKQNGGKK